MLCTIHIKKPLNSAMKEYFKRKKIILKYLCNTKHRKLNNRVSASLMNNNLKNSLLSNSKTNRINIYFDSYNICRIDIYFISIEIVVS